MTTLAPPIPETAPAALALLDQLDASDVAVSPADPDTWAADVQRKADELRRTVRRDEQVSMASLEARASARLSEAHATTREASFDALVGSIDQMLADADRRLQVEAESRRAVRLPAVGLLPHEQASRDRERQSSALLGTANETLFDVLAESRRGNALTAELIAAITLPETTATDALLHEMEHGSPYMAHRAEQLVRGRLAQLRVASVTAETQQAKDEAREALAAFTRIREGRVSDEARQAEASEQAAWAALAQHAQHVRSRVAVWRQAGIAHDTGATAETLAKWKAERATIRRAFEGTR